MKKRIMNNIKNNLKKNVKIIIGIFIGILVTGVSVYAATVIDSTEVSYTSNGNSTVKGAIDDLYSIASSWINPSYINFGTLDTNVKKTVLASSDGVCIKRNNKVSCFKKNNWNVEKDHIQEVFSDITCSVSSSNVNCDTSDFSCHIYSYGTVSCRDESDSSYCSVDGSGTVSCTKPLGMQMNSAKTIVATSAGVMFKRANGNVYFLGINNYAYEKEHIQSIFSDVTCDDLSERISCNASDFKCEVGSGGSVYCRDDSAISYCATNYAGSITCD